MPTLYGVEVKVMNTDCRPFIEYSTRSVGLANTKSKIASTQIEARTGKSFYIKIKPTIPFPFDDREESDNVPSADEGRELHHHYKQSSGRSVRQVSSRSEEPCVKDLAPHVQRVLRGRALGDTNKATEFSSVTPDRKIPQFDLIAAVYIDGQTKPECRQIIHLDPVHPRYSEEGEILRGRWVPATEHGKSNENQKPVTQFGIGDKLKLKLGVCRWVFTSVGIDVLMSRMDVNAPNPDIPTTGVEREVTALTSMLAHHAVDAQHRPKSGQIEVRLSRVITLGMRHKQFDSRTFAGNDPVNTSLAADAECTHTMALQAEDVEKVKVNHMSWRYYKKNEEVYARFVFRYMGREKLVKLGLCYEDGKATVEDCTEARKEAGRAQTQKKRGRETENMFLLAGLNDSVKTGKRYKPACNVEQDDSKSGDVE